MKHLHEIYTPDDVPLWNRTSPNVVGVVVNPLTRQLERKRVGVCGGGFSVVFWLVELFGHCGVQTVVRALTQSRNAKPTNS